MFPLDHRRRYLACSGLSAPLPAMRRLGRQSRQQLLERPAQRQPAAAGGGGVGRGPADPLEPHRLSRGDLRDQRRQVPDLSDPSRLTRPRCGDGAADRGRQDDHGAQRDADVRSAPTFVGIASMPSTTPLSLRAFLLTPYARMPDAPEPG